MTAIHSVTGGQDQPDFPSHSLGGHAGPAHGAAAGSSSIGHSSATPPASPTPPPHPSSAIAAEFYQAAVMNAGIPVISLDPAGCIVAWNAAAVRMFGRHEAEVLGRPFDTLIPPEYRPTASLAFQRTIQQRSVNVYEMSVVPQGGRNPVHVGVTLSCVAEAPSAGGGGGLRGVMAWMRDISNRKELESHLTRTRHMASIGTLAAGVAHHFNNIACGMGTMVEFALATEDPGAMLKALRMAAEACTRISYITQGLLQCSCERTGEPDLSDLTEELLRFADAVEPTLNQKGIALELDLKALRISAVPRVRFGQALQHLLRNAEDAIAARSAEVIGALRKITLRTMSQGDQIMLQFSDSGMGIEADDLPHIFDPFYTTKGVQGGGNEQNPGLGLTLVHSVIMEMGGHIWADSVRGQGTTIHILVPVQV